MTKDIVEQLLLTTFDCLFKQMKYDESQAKIPFPKEANMQDCIIISFKFQLYKLYCNIVLKFKQKFINY